jgi:hypothetical protein
LCILIVIIVGFFALSGAFALPSNVSFDDERPRYRRVPGDKNSSQNTVVEEAALAMDGIYMPIPR